MRRAVLASTLGLAVAVTIGVGGLMLTVPASTTAEAAAGDAPALTLAERAGDPSASSLVPVLPRARASAYNASQTLAVTILPMPERVVGPPGDRDDGLRVDATPGEAEQSAAFIAQPDPGDAAPPAEPATVPAPEPAPALGGGERASATLSFYYCVQGPQVSAVGDGGGFCGAMRDGTVVYPGAAACDVAYLGQEFRIEGDPHERVYRCADTGSAVHGMHRDIWFHSSDEGWDWQRTVGHTATIEILP